MKPDIDYTLYLCTDRNIMTTETIEESVELFHNAGVIIHLFTQFLSAHIQIMPYLNHFLWLD